MAGTKRVFSEEHKKKLSEAKKKNPVRYWLGKKKPPVSKETRRKLREACLRNGTKPPIRTGEANNKWKGGITPRNKMIKQSVQYKKWRTRVFERDDYCCQICSKKGGKLQVDHIMLFSIYPELVFDELNGQTLCFSCHQKTDTFSGKIQHWDVSMTYLIKNYG